MSQIKISLSDRALEFVERYEELGYTSKSTIIESAITKLQEKVNREQLEQSAALYQDIYEQDKDLQRLTDSAASSCLD